ncbi:COM1 regulatory protein [Emericellopsis atlantica]|uniref:COM1 regulatory protein n=1 Tax=Emericellopsis atlantica TaxID=2614577 RepID=A0A9P8CQU5_9HYPO|nr:COM1 regulatory protein [Emericellopsis atlantica]KAG9256018.1 COM1 regulatory protein [Emericellopsis atlantica]
MNSLKIPDNGVQLKGSSAEDTHPLTQQAFTISLSDNVIEGMIKCVQNGGDISLALGSDPTFHYDSTSHRIPSPAVAEDEPYDLYLTQPYNSLREGTRIPSMPLFMNPKLNRIPGVKKAPSAAKPKAKTSSASSRDSDLGRLQNDLRAAEASKEGTRILSKPLINGKNGKLSAVVKDSASRSLSTSPALKPVSSPMLNPAKEARAALVHELAIHDRTYDELKGKWDGKPEDLRNALEKIADQDKDNKQLWKMRAKGFKELDVWNYDYSDADRETAINNAIKQYDKLRLSASDPEWERLNRPEDRGKGIFLSKLQANIARGAPKIKVQKAEESSASSRDDGDGSSEKSRSSDTKKKISSSEAQVKRLLNGKCKPSTPVPKTTKPSPTKAKAASTTKPSNTKANKGRGPLSAEYIGDSDSSGGRSPAPAKAKPTSQAARDKANANEKPVGKVEKVWRGEKAKEKERMEKEKAEKERTEKEKAEARRPATKTAPAPRPLPKPMAKRPRPEEDEDSSSSSGTPLSKRIKSKPLPAQQLNRPAETLYNKSKTRSPSKSSPLGSSPPTNASDISDHSSEPHPRKRKAEDERSAPNSKRQTLELSDSVMSQAQDFKKFYSAYEALHYEVVALVDPPKEKLDSLIDMRERLTQMKKKIYRQCNV